jgi:hypothetical protein
MTFHGWPPRSLARLGERGVNRRSVDDSLSTTQYPIDAQRRSLARVMVRGRQAVTVIVGCGRDGVRA